MIEGDLTGKFLIHCNGLKIRVIGKSPSYSEKYPFWVVEDVETSGKSREVHYDNLKQSIDISDGNFPVSRISVSKHTISSVVDGTCESWKIGKETLVIAVKEDGFSYSYSEDSNKAQVELRAFLKAHSHVVPYVYSDGCKVKILFIADDNKESQKTIGLG